MTADWTGKRIRELRKRYDESQGEFCRRVGVTVDALRMWEQGRGAPSRPCQMLLDRIEEDIDNGTPRPLHEFQLAAS